MIVAAQLVAACGPDPATVAPAGPSLSSAEVEARPSEAEQEAMRLRAEWGLQADLAHVRAVAADASATEYLSILMLPDEIADMQARAANTDAVRDIVQAEANAAADDFCGSYVDNQNRGAFTSMWRANLAVHAAAIRTKVHPTARLAFRDCRFSVAELTRLCELLNAADHGWMAEIPARPIGWGCGSAENFVTLDISSAVPSAAATVLRDYTAAFDLPPGILFVRSDGTGARLKPWGTVLVTVLDLHGQPVGPNSLSLNWFSDFEGLRCGLGDVGYGVSWDENPTELPCQEGTWTIQIVGFPQPDQDAVTYGSSVARVVGDGVTRVTFRLQQPPPPIGP